MYNTLITSVELMSDVGQVGFFKLPMKIVKGNLLF